MSLNDVAGIVNIVGVMLDRPDALTSELIRLASANG